MSNQISPRLLLRHLLLHRWIATSTNSSKWFRFTFLRNTAETRVPTIAKVQGPTLLVAHPAPRLLVFSLRRVAAPCRVDGYSTSSHSRLCEEHALQLVSKKAQSLVCTTQGVQRHAYYAVNPAVGNKPEWRGILIRDAAAQLDATGPAKPH